MTKLRVLPAILAAAFAFAAGGLVSAENVRLLGLSGSAQSPLEMTRLTPNRTLGSPVFGAKPVRCDVLFYS
jgi:hypothetical protein